MQLVVNTLVLAATFSLAALSFRLVYRAGRFFYLAHAGVITLGPYCAYVLARSSGTVVEAMVVPAVVLTGLMGCGLFLLFIRPLIRRGASPRALLLAAVALQIGIQHTLALIFGDDARALLPTDRVPVFDLGGLFLTAAQATLIASAVAVAVGLACIQRFTLLGLQLEATADHRELSAIFGVPTHVVELTAFGIASAIGGLLGILVGIDLSYFPGLGFNLLLPGVVVLLIAGVERIGMVVVASLLVSVLLTATVWYLGSAWEQVVLYSVLFAYFLARPTGLGHTVART